MALVLANVFGPSAKKSLSQEIDAFEAALTREQRAGLLATRIRFTNQPPSVHDVMQLTAEIDRNARLKNGAGGRCFGPRLTKMLESVQQFASIGDVIIGGSQNLIACGVWSLVRTTLLMTSRFASYLEGISALFMSIGQTAPRYQDMMSLHPESKRLQTLVLEYFAKVVQVCRQVAIMCNQSVLGQLKAFVKDVDVATHQSDLIRFGDSIKDQLLLEEACENAVSRQRFAKLSSSEQHRQKLADRNALLDACSTFEYQQPWRKARKSGTCAWFADEPAYVKWRMSSQSSLLVLSGKLGAGKTTLLANMVDDLNLNGGGVFYYFCQAQSDKSLRIATIIGCIVRQVLESLQVDTTSIIWQEHLNRGGRLDVEALLMTKDMRGRPICLIVDGADDCSRETINSLRDWFCRLEGHLKLKVCISERLAAENSLARIRTIPWQSHSTMLMPENNSDIWRFVQTSLEESLESGELVLGDPSLIFEIEEALLSGAKGMFLWVVLQMKAVCQHKTDFDIRVALQNLPKDLPSAFARILRQSGVSNLVYQSRILEFLIAALRPLRHDELQDALSVSPGDIDRDPAKFVNDIQSVLETCGSLISIDEETSQVNFIHPSVAQFLSNEDGQAYGMQVDKAQANFQLAHTCLTYLAYDIFDNQVADRVAPSLTLNRIPMKLIAANRETNKMVNSAALWAFRSKKGLKVDIGKVIAAHIPAQGTPSTHIPFWNYASNYWSQHIENAQSLDSKIIPLLKIQLGKSHPEYKKYPGAESVIQFEVDETTLYWRSKIAWPDRAGTSYVAREFMFCEVKCDTNNFRDSLSRSMGHLNWTMFARWYNSPTLWALQNSNLPVLRHLLRNPRTGIATFCKAMAYARVLMVARPFKPFEDISVSLCLKLFCIATLFEDYDICALLFRRCRHELGWEESVVQITGITHNPQAVSMIIHASR